MLQMYTNEMEKSYRLFDLQGTIGLFVYAFIRPDQVDVWDREPLCEPRDNQIDRSD